MCLLMFCSLACGSDNSPTAIETHFGWVHAGGTDGNITLIPSHGISCYVALSSCDDLLRWFWEIEDSPLLEIALSPEERVIVQHFEITQVI